MEIGRVAAVGDTKVQLMTSKDGERYVSIDTTPVMGFGGSHIVSVRDAHCLRQALKILLNGVPPL
jgi:hypothetical protein